jgi:hypothetical protein
MTPKRKMHPDVQAAHPTWLPVDGPQWRLVDQNGTMLRDVDGDSMRFSSDVDALRYLKIKKIPLLKPRW